MATPKSPKISSSKRSRKWTLVSDQRRGNLSLPAGNRGGDFPLFVCAAHDLQDARLSDPAVPGVRGRDGERLGDLSGGFLSGRSPARPAPPRPIRRGL